MRRYSLDIGGRNFVIDVQELANDRFEVVVGDNAYEVKLAGDENLSEATITPGLPVEPDLRPAAISSVSRVRKEPSATPAASPKPTKSAGGAGGKNSINAPMPGVILELNVQVGDTLQRGQQVAVLDAMKMHNTIGAPRDGTVAEVCVTVGQSVEHGETLIRYQES